MIWWWSQPNIYICRKSLSNVWDCLMREFHESKELWRMKMLTDETLLDSYYRAIDLKLDRDFINLLLAEIRRRNLQDSITKGAWTSPLDMMPFRYRCQNRCCAWSTHIQVNALMVARVDDPVRPFEIFYLPVWRIRIERVAVSAAVFTVLSTSRTIDNLYSQTVAYRTLVGHVWYLP